MTALPLTGFNKSTPLPAQDALPVVSNVTRRHADARTDPAWVRWLVIAVAVGFMGLFIVLPLVCVFAQAFSKGLATYIAALSDPDTLSAIRLTLIIAAISVATNVAVRRHRRLGDHQI